MASDVWWPLIGALIQIASLHIGLWLVCRERLWNRRYLLSVEITSDMLQLTTKLMRNSFTTKLFLLSAVKNKLCLIHRRKSRPNRHIEWYGINGANKYASHHRLFISQARSRSYGEPHHAHIHFSHLGIKAYNCSHATMRHS